MQQYQKFRALRTTENVDLNKFPKLLWNWRNKSIFDNRNYSPADRAAHFKAMLKTFAEKGTSGPAAPLYRGIYIEYDKLPQGAKLPLRLFTSFTTQVESAAWFLNTSKPGAGQGPIILRLNPDNLAPSTAVLNVSDSKNEHFGDVGEVVLPPGFLTVLKYELIVVDGLSVPLVNCHFKPDTALKKTAKIYGMMKDGKSEKSITRAWYW